MCHWSMKVCLFNLLEGIVGFVCWNWSVCLSIWSVCLFVYSWSVGFCVDSQVDECVCLCTSIHIYI